MTRAQPLPSRPAARSRWAVALAAVLLAPPAALRAESPTLDLSRTAVLRPAGLAGPERKAVQMLIEEVEKRSRLRWAEARDWPEKATPAALVAPAGGRRRSARAAGLA